MVKGVAELNKAVAAMPKRVENAARKAMEKGAQELVDMMKRLCPVDDGNLRDSIGWTWGDAPKGSFVVVKARGGFEYSAMQITVYAGNEKAFYARFIEFGTAPHNVAEGGGNVGFTGSAFGHPGAPAQPFFFPSYRALRKRIKSRIMREMKRSIKFVGPVTSGEAG